LNLVQVVINIEKVVINNPKAVAVLVGAAFVVASMILWTINPLLSLVLGIGGFGIIFAVVAPKTFDHVIREIVKEIRKA